MPLLASPKAIYARRQGMKASRVFLMGWVCLDLTMLGLKAGPLDEWIPRQPLGTLNLEFKAATFGDGEFVEVGPPNVVATSPDGANWSSWGSGQGFGLNGLAYANGEFAAVGDNGRIAYSSDGTNWSGLDIPYTPFFSAVAYGAGQFVAVGAGGSVDTSADGTNWTKQVSGTSADLHGIAYGGDQFVAVGTTGTILNSPTGVNWTLQHTGTNTLWGIAAGANQFVAVGGVSEIVPGAILTSQDGTNWVYRNSGAAYPLRAVTYGGGFFVAVGDRSTILTSPDGVTWTNRDVGIADDFVGIAYGDEQFIALGSSSTNYQSRLVTPPPPSPPHLEEIMPYEGRYLGLIVDGRAGQIYDFQWSTNLVDWKTFTRQISTNTTSVFRLLPSTRTPRFYRVEFVP